MGSYRYVQNMVSALAIPVFPRLLYSSGMRPIEIRLLHRASVNLEEGTIHIHVNETKGYKERILAIHINMLPVLRAFDEKMNKILPDREYFFANSYNQPLSSWWYEKVFRGCWPDSKVVLNGFRHNYVIENIMRMDATSSFNRDLFTLSTSMGHTSIKRTKYYAHLTPAFYDLIVRPETTINYEED